MRTAVIGGGLLAVGVGLAVAGVVPAAEVLALWQRYWPIMLFVVAVTIVAELAAAGGLFDAIAAGAARFGGGRGAVLWLIVVAVAVAATVFLSLDTTALLLTPVAVVLARRIGMNPIPFALTTVWLANTASLLLPVSNLTNLLAVGALGDPHPLVFAAMMWAPAIAGILVPVAVIAVVYRRSLFVRYRITAGPARRADPVLLRWSAIVVAALIALLVSGVPVWLSAAAAAVVLAVVFALRRRPALGWGSVPWSLLLLVAGLFLVMTAAGHLGATAALGTLAGGGEDAAGLVRLAGVSAASANVANNLPAYLAMEPIAHGQERLAAVLIGVNAGPLITPWASLATLLWHDRLRGLGIHVSWRNYVLLGILTAPLTVAAATGALVLSHG